MCNAKNHPDGCDCGWGPKTGVAGDTADISKPKEKPKTKPKTEEEKQKDKEKEKVKKEKEKVKKEYDKAKKVFDNLGDVVDNELRKRSGWIDKLKLAFEAESVINQALVPDAMDDVAAGDILLIAPEKDSKVSKMFQELDRFLTGRKNLEPASHALTVVRRKRNGELMYLDHTKEGSRIISETEFQDRYGKRGMHVARPLAMTDGRELLKQGLENAQMPDSDYGITGKNAVCSERAGLLVGKATGLPLDKFKRKGPDITPGDFFDKRHVGKYFTVNPLTKTKQTKNKTSTKD